MSLHTGNRLTANAFTANDGKALIARALLEVEEETGWKPRDEKPLFTGVFYDPQKVGSVILRVGNAREESAVLKVQLHPLPFEEAMIMRHVQAQLKTDRVRLPRIIRDAPWEERRGYGFLLTEDLSHLPKLWAGHSPTAAERGRHTSFLNSFMHEVLPITPFLPEPTLTPAEKYQESLAHFSAVAAASAHAHVAAGEVARMRNAYEEAIARTTFGGFHFTHGHLSGMEILEDRHTDTFVLMSNLLWSFRPTYYEVVFPFWVDVMGIRDTRVTAAEIFARVDHWADVWQKVMGEDPRESPFFWFLLLERAFMTVMLDLGASDWRNESAEKQALLNAWQAFFWEVHGRRMAG